MYNEVEEALGQGSPLVGAIPQTLAALALVYEPSTVCLSDTEVRTNNKIYCFYHSIKFSPNLH